MTDKAHNGNSSSVSTVYLYTRVQQAEDIKLSLRVTMAAARDKVCYAITTVSTSSIDHLPYRRETHTPKHTTCTHSHTHAHKHTTYTHKPHTHTQTYRHGHTAEPN